MIMLKIWKLQIEVNIKQMISHRVIVPLRILDQKENLLVFY